MCLPVFKGNRDRGGGKERGGREGGGEGAGGHSTHAGKRQEHGIHLTRVSCEAGTVSRQDPLTFLDMFFFSLGGKGHQ